LIIETILWQGRFFPGHEICRLSSQDSGWQLEGTAVFSRDRHPCQLSYLVRADSGWQMLSGQIHGWLGNTMVDIQVASDQIRHWWLNGVACPEVTGCIELDLNFSTSTSYSRFDRPVGGRNVKGAVSIPEMGRSTRLAAKGGMIVG